MSLTPADDNSVPLSYRTQQTAGSTVAASSAIDLRVLPLPPPPTEPDISSVGTVGIDAKTAQIRTQVSESTSKSGARH
ncbi:MAG: hypothetical protein Q4P71_02575 [Actinomycetaceae bacterium]|nr:hypothetical protein [Actinomycetaceae bacterium]